MTITIASQALLAAARVQRVVDPETLHLMRERLAAQPLRTPTDLRTWLTTNSQLAAEQISGLVGLLPPQGRDFTPYRTLVRLATGGMGAIWLAAAPNEQLVVVKTLIDGQTGDGVVATDPDGDLWIIENSHGAAERPISDALQRLERETRITRSLDHPHVVRCLDQGLTSDGQMFLVLEHMASGDLAELLTDHGHLSEALTLSLARQICAALAIAHGNKLLHRDVKPGNIFLAADGHAKLADFGFARSNQLNRTQLTLAGSVLGSPLYMAPEQVTADTALDIRCDLYGLGCVLFHCLSGTPPYAGSMHAVLRAHCTAPVPELVALRAGLHPLTSALVTRLLQKKPGDRHPDPNAVAGEIAAALHGLGLQSDHLEPLPQHASAPVLTPVLAPEKTPEKAPPAEPLIGDCVVLAGDGVADECVQVYCLARARLSLGKLRGPSVDVCLRNYPEEAHRTECIAISRMHLAVTATAAQVTVEDLGSANGTTLDGTALAARTPQTLTSGQNHRLEVARTVQLVVRAVTQVNAVAGVVIQRLGNRPQLAYALVIQALSIGGPGADVVLPGAAANSGPGNAHLLGQVAGRWVHRAHAAAPWQALHAGDLLVCGGLRLTARNGSCDDL